MGNGKEFELLVESIYREIDPSATITRNDKIWGERSKGYREIDLSIRAKVCGLHPVLFIVQAKDHTRALDVNVVGEFASVIEEVGATKGILISSKGFTQHARSFALSKGIDLLTAHDSKKPKWKVKLDVPVILTTFNGTFELPFQMTFTQEYVDRIGERPVQPPSNMLYKFTPDKGKTIITPIEDFRERYRHGSLITDGTDRFLEYPNMDLIVEDGLLIPATDIRLRYNMVKTTYHKNYPLKEFKGFVSGFNKEVTSVHYRIETDELIVENNNVGVVKPFSFTTWEVLTDESLLGKPFKINLLHLPQLQTNAKATFKKIKSGSE